MWSSAKSLRCIVSDVVCNGKADRLLEMESSFKKHRQLLLSPLTFPEKCESDYESVKNAHSSAVMLPDFPHRVQLSEDVVHESLFLSEVFKLNELLAVELCLTVESQLSFFPRLTRGLVGVLLYYESHLSIIDALATLIAARDGRMWPSSTTAEICQTLHAITDDLFASGLLQNILGALQAFSAHAEFSRLENLQVLGDSKHRHDVFMLLKNISEGLSECVMLWSCQNALNLNEFKLVLDCLLSSKPQNSSTRTDSSQSQLTFQNNDQLSREGLHLLMSLLHCLQPFSSSTPCADQVSDLTDYDWIHPLYTDHSFASGIGRLLDYRKSVCENHSNETDSHQLKLLGLIRLSWALCLRKTSHLRAELRRRRNVDVSRSAPNTGVSENVLTSISEKDFGIGGDEEDELQAASAIESGALEFARKNVLNTPNFERETLWVYCMHCIITDLIVHMTARVKEIRLRDEDLLRSTGFDPSTTGHGFANFLLLIAQLYNQPGSRLHGRLALEYWWPVGELVNITPVALGSGDLLSSSVTNKSPRRKFSLYGTRSRNAELDNIRQAALMRFLRLAGDMVTTPCLFLPYLRVLHGLCCSRSAAGLCFSLLKANATNPGRGASLITWDHFFNSFRQYLNHMKQVVMQSEPVNLRLQASNQLYPHIYYSDGAASRPRGSGCPRSATESMYVGKKGVGATDLSTTAPVVTQPRSIQPEEQAGLQAVLRLVARICRMDPVARSAFISNPQWQVVPMCMGFLTCPVSLDLKADVLYLLTELGKSQQNVPLLWQHFVSAELLPFTIIRSGGQPQSTNGLNTDMDEVEPRAEEYPLTNAFLTLMTVMLPKLINYPIASNSLKSSDGKEISSYGLSGGGNVMQANPFVSITSFITNTIFLRHTMRAYRNPVERWDIAASCLVLFDGLVNDFLNRLNNATVMITTLMTSNHEKDVDNLDSLFASSSTPVSDVNCGKIQQSVDWPSCLLSILFQMGKEQQIHGRHLYSTTTTPTTTATSEVLINQLHLPAGWPYSDPGYHLAAQLLTDSSLFRMVTGLLEVGLHRHLEFPIPNGPPAGMTRATYAGLSLIRRLLASEDILVTFVRRIATNVQPRMGSAQTAISNISVPLPNLPSFGLTVLPVYVSRLLMSTNSGSGRADLIPMLLKYCMLADYLPDHTSCAVSILGYLAASIKPHSDLLALLTVDEATRSQLLGAFAYLIKWPVSTLSNSTTLNPTDSQCVTYNLDNEGYFAFTDEWLHGDNYDDRGLCLRTTGTFSARLPPPASYAARVDAAFPSQTTSWYFPNLTWERWASYVNTYFSTWSDIRITHNRIMINSDYYTTAFGDWFYQVTTDSNTVPISVSFLQILLAVMDHPTPNLAHWLCGFRFDSCKAISRSNLQDAGISDQQRTCLHSMLDLIDTTSHWLQSASTLPFEFACTLHWNSALIWQILYRLGSNPLTSEPLLRFLRSNHDLLAKYLHLDVCHSPFSSSVIGNICESFTARQKAVVEALSLNRKNWILRLYAIEIRVSAIANQRSYVTRLLKLFLGDLLFDNSLVPSVNESRESPSVLVSFIQLLNASEEFISKSNPLESKMFDSSLIHEVMAKSEVACSLLTSDSNAARSLSTMIHFKIFLMSLYIKLVGLRSDMDTYTHEDLNRLLTLTFEQVFDVSISAHDLSSLELFNAASSSTSVSTLIKQISAVREWIDTRNIHGLQLYVGKQAAIEAWRQAVEISLGLLTNQPYYGNKVQKSSQLVPCVSSYLHSELISVIRDGGLNDSIECKPQLRPVPVLCMDVLVLLLSQICAIKEVPQTIRLLASGTCLTLCSFLHCQSNIISMKSNVSESGGVNKCTYHKHWSSLLVSLMGLLIRSIVRTKTSTQRMRANYYGSLCYVIRFCRNLGQSLKEDKMASSDFKSLSECFSVFTSSSVSGFDTNHSGSVDPSDLNQLHSMLITDLIHGHTVTQMAAMSLLELLVSFDRCSQQLISHLDTQGTIQHILDTVMEDLNTISKFLTSIDTGMLDDSSAAHNNRRSHLPVDPIGSCISTAVSAFLLYQSKMSLLCRIGSYPVGAKVDSTSCTFIRLIFILFFNTIKYYFRCILIA
ncbi:unnamed protein product [Heterobilharzia americana]|nr:unnamed protein product [Heterobilharzia americana]